MSTGNRIIDNLYGNMLCAIDTETTGLDPKVNDVIQVAIIPLGADLKPNKKIMPFNMHIKPMHPENISSHALRVNKKNIMEIISKGIDAFQAADLLDEWFERLHLGAKKRIIPVGHNYVFDMGFLKEWLGELNYEHLFHYHYRDTMRVALYLNDRAISSNSFPPYHNVSLTSMANRLGIDTSNAHDALEDCVITAEVYRRLVNHHYQ